MKYTITKYIAIVILLTVGFLTVRAQEPTETSTLVTTTENTSFPKKRQSNSTNDWSGFYVGGFGGMTIGRAQARTSIVSGSQSQYGVASVGAINNLGNQTIKSTGFNGGGTIGFNYQQGHLFVGGEADFGSNRVNSSVTANGMNPTQTINVTITQSVKTDWLLTARPRGGVAFKKALIYVTGGVAVTKVEYAEAFKETNYFSSESGSFQKTKAGWTAGAGAEFKIANRWSVKGEYLFSQFGRTSITSNNFVFLGSPFPTVFTHSTDLKSHNIRFGVNYRF